MSSNKLTLDSMSGPVTLSYRSKESNFLFDSYEYHGDYNGVTICYYIGDEKKEKRVRFESPVMLISLD